MAEEASEKAGKTVEELREILRHFISQLTPDVEPAVVYALEPPAVDDH